MLTCRLQSTLAAEPVELYRQCLCCTLLVCDCDLCCCVSRCTASNHTAGRMFTALAVASQPAACHLLPVLFPLSSTAFLQVGALCVVLTPTCQYYKVQYASMCLLLNPGCLFIATNTDARGHFTPNLEWAGAGATVGAIKGELHSKHCAGDRPAAAAGDGGGDCPAGANISPLCRPKDRGACMWFICRSRGMGADCGRQAQPSAAAHGHQQQFDPTLDCYMLLSSSPCFCRCCGA